MDVSESINQNAFKPGITGAKNQIVWLKITGTDAKLVKLVDQEIERDEIIIIDSPRIGFLSQSFAHWAILACNTFGDASEAKVCMCKAVHVRDRQTLFELRVLELDTDVFVIFFADQARADRRKQLGRDVAKREALTLIFLRAHDL